jgi:TusA-related sulfurtransferase
LLCLKKCPGKFLDSLVTIYNDTTGNAHKHITCTDPSLHLARKCQSLEPKQLILILISASASANNIHTFIESNNDAVIKRVHVLITWLVINCKAPLSLATNVDLNKVIQAASYLKPGSYVPMTPGKIDRALISMFSKFTVCVNTFIVKARAMYMLANYDELANKYVGSSYG